MDTDTKCPSCARQRLVRDSIVTLLFGWWSLLGLIFTPLMVMQNVEQYRAVATDNPDARRSFAADKMVTSIRLAAGKQAAAAQSKVLAAIAIAFVLVVVGGFVCLFAFYTPD